MVIGATRDYDEAVAGEDGKEYGVAECPASPRASATPEGTRSLRTQAGRLLLPSGPYRCLLESQRHTVMEFFEPNVMLSPVISA